FIEHRPHVSRFIMDRKSRQNTARHDALPQRKLDETAVDCRAAGTPVNDRASSLGLWAEGNVNRSDRRVLDRGCPICVGSSAGSHCAGREISVRRGEQMRITRSVGIAAVVALVVWAAGANAFAADPI